MDCMEPKVCRRMPSSALFMGVGLLLYLHLGSLGRSYTHIWTLNGFGLLLYLHLRSRYKLVNEFAWEDTLEHHQSCGRGEEGRATQKCRQDGWTIDSMLAAQQFCWVVSGCRV